MGDMRLLYHRLGELALGISLLILVGAFGGFRPVFEYFAHQNPIVPESLTGEYDRNDTKGTFHGQAVASSEVYPGRLARVLGESTGPKRIEVDLTNQKVYAYEGNQKVYEFLISSGKWYPTPTGTFNIWGKYRYIKMSGGNPTLGTYYYLPNVPFVMFFGNAKIPASRGFSLHGTYWHNNFGRPMSHGCVNMRTEDAEVLFYWSQPTVGEKNATRADAGNPGTEIRIYGEAPKN